MNADKYIQTCVDAVQPNLQDGESIVQVRRAAPLPVGRADYFTRFKVDIALPNGSGSEITRRRCLIVSISSNTGQASIDDKGWDPIPNVIGL
jgi:hypothetical protein